MDIQIDNEEINFKCRANGIIIKNDKVLMCQINDNHFLCCPGGHIHLGENSQNAVLREVKEESGIDATNPQLISIVENFFENEQGKKYHEVSFYFMLDAFVPEEKLVNFALNENDEGEIVHLEFKWVPLDKIEFYDIRPLPVKDILRKKDFKFHHILI